MADKKVQPIRSLDELETGDVIDVGFPFIVAGFGDVPGHEKEVSLVKLYGPKKAPGYRARTVRQSELNRTVVLSKFRKEDYTGWQYRTSENGDVRVI